VGAVQRRLAINRPVALLLSLLAIAVVLAVGTTAIVPPFVAQFSELVQKLPEAWHELLSLLHQGLESISRMLYGRSDGGLSWLQNLGGSVRTSPAIASGVGNWTFRLVGLVGNVGCPAHRLPGSPAAVGSLLLSAPGPPGAAPVR
jgi:predicted PurR-regulated permease PerM